MPVKGLLPHLQRPCFIGSSACPIFLFAYVLLPAGVVPGAGAAALPSLNELLSAPRKGSLLELLIKGKGTRGHMQVCVEGCVVCGGGCWGVGVLLC